MSMVIFGSDKDRAIQKLPMAIQKAPYNPYSYDMLFGQMKNIADQEQPSSKKELKAWLDCNKKYGKLLLRQGDRENAGKYFSNVIPSTGPNFIIHLWEQAGKKYRKRQKGKSDNGVNYPLSLCTIDLINIYPNFHPDDSISIKIFNEYKRQLYGYALEIKEKNAKQEFLDYANPLFWNLYNTKELTVYEKEKLHDFFELYDIAAKQFHDPLLRNFALACLEKGKFKATEYLRNRIKKKYGVEKENLGVSFLSNAELCVFFGSQPLLRYEKSLACLNKILNDENFEEKKEEECEVFFEKTGIFSMIKNGPIDEKQNGIEKVSRKDYEKRCFEVAHMAFAITDFVSTAQCDTLFEKAWNLLSPWRRYNTFLLKTYLSTGKGMAYTYALKAFERVGETTWYQQLTKNPAVYAQIMQNFDNALQLENVQDARYLALRIAQEEKNYARVYACFQQMLQNNDAWAQDAECRQYVGEAYEHLSMQKIVAADEKCEKIFVDTNDSCYMQRQETQKEEALPVIALQEEKIIQEVQLVCESPAQVPPSSSDVEKKANVVAQKSDLNMVLSQCEASKDVQEKINIIEGVKVSSKDKRKYNSRIQKQYKAIVQHFMQVKQYDDVEKWLGKMGNKKEKNIFLFDYSYVAHCLQKKQSMSYVWAEELKNKLESMQQVPEDADALYVYMRYFLEQNSADKAETAYEKLEKLSAYTDDPYCEKVRQMQKQKSDVIVLDARENMTTDEVLKLCSVYESALAQKEGKEARDIAFMASIKGYSWQKNATEEKIKMIGCIEKISKHMPQKQQKMITDLMRQQSKAVVGELINDKKYALAGTWFEKGVSKKEKSALMQKLSIAVQNGDVHALKLYLQQSGTPSAKNYYDNLEKYLLPKEEGLEAEIHKKFLERVEKLVDTGTIDFFEDEKLGTDASLKGLLGYVYYMMAEAMDQEGLKKTYYEKAWSYNKDAQADTLSGSLACKIVHLLTGKGVEKQDVQAACDLIRVVPFADSTIDNKSHFKRVLRHMNLESVPLQISERQEDIIHFFAAHGTYQQDGIGKNEFSKLVEQMNERTEITEPYICLKAMASALDEEKCDKNRLISTFWVLSDTVREDKKLWSLYEDTLAHFSAKLSHDGFEMKTYDAVPLMHLFDVLSLYVDQNRQQIISGGAYEKIHHLWCSLCKQKLIQSIGYLKDGDSLDEVLSACDGLIKHNQFDIYGLRVQIQNNKKMFSPHFARHVKEYCEYLIADIKNNKGCNITKQDIAILLQSIYGSECKKDLDYFCEKIELIMNTISPQLKSDIEKDCSGNLEALYILRGRYYAENLQKLQSNQKKAFECFDQASLYHKNVHNDSLNLALLNKGKILINQSKYKEAATCYEELKNMDFLAKKVECSAAKHMFCQALSMIFMHSIKNDNTKELVDLFARLGRLFARDMMYENYYEYAKVAEGSPVYRNVIEVCPKFFQGCDYSFGRIGYDHPDKESQKWGISFIRRAIYNNVAEAMFFAGYNNLCQDTHGVYTVEKREPVVPDTVVALDLLARLYTAQEEYSEEAGYLLYHYLGREQYLGKDNVLAWSVRKLFEEIAKLKDANAENISAILSSKAGELLEYSLKHNHQWIDKVKKPLLNEETKKVVNKVCSLVDTSDNEEVKIRALGLVLAYTRALCCKSITDAKKIFDNKISTKEEAKAKNIITIIENDGKKALEYISALRTLMQQKDALYALEVDIESTMASVRNYCGTEEQMKDSFNRLKELGDKGNKIAQVKSKVLVLEYDIGGDKKEALNYIKNYIITEGAATYKDLLTPHCMADNKDEVKIPLMLEVLRGSNEAAPWKEFLQGYTQWYKSTYPYDLPGEMRVKNKEKIEENEKIFKEALALYDIKETQDNAREKYLLRCNEDNRYAPACLALILDALDKKEYNKAFEYFTLYRKCISQQQMHNFWATACIGYLRDKLGEIAKYQAEYVIIARYLEAVKAYDADKLEPIDTQ